MKHLNDEHEQDYKDARQGRIGADRMAIGLSSIPDPVRGDMDRVIILKDAVATLKMELAKLGSYQP